MFSLPSPYGIGTLGKAAYRWIDFLYDAGQTLWQVLPIGPTSYGDSPYQSYSSFAGNPYFIDLELLCEEGLLNKSECDGVNWGDDETRIDYARIYTQRFTLLKKAFERSVKNNLSLIDFECQHKWVSDYALFMTIKNMQKGNSWPEWPHELRVRNISEVEKIEKQYEDDIQFYIFIQFVFWKQWNSLKQYANQKGIKIIGDIPIYTALDSADVWTNQGLFCLDKNGRPTEIAGCPPDAFSSTGQLWGNPLYRWTVMESTGYSWWMERMQSAFDMFDVVKIDHFRGFESYYAIPASEKTAENGYWKRGPGMSFIKQIYQSFSNPAVIAEDLGFLTKEVQDLLKNSGFPGMKVLQFAFDKRESSDYLPHTYSHNSVVYTGTHDNETTAEWIDSAPSRDLDYAKRYLRFRGNTKEDLCRELVCTALASVCNTAIIPLQDWMALDGKARINKPSTVGNNWRWRMRSNACTQKLAREIRSITELYARI